MNYLAHLYIAAHTKTSFSGNFLGDFVKGAPEGKFPNEIVTGIRLHRFIDTFTDQHPKVRAAKLLFIPPLRRYAPIALDMFWDHFLAVHWQQFHPLSLTDFCLFAEQKIKDETKNKNVYLPDKFVRVNRYVWEEKWFESYKKTMNIEYALRRMATRSARMAPLAETGPMLNTHYDVLNVIFVEFYEDLLAASMAFVNDLHIEMN